jgi:DNA-binding CsgD family transcriptional regulator/tetratricopeptide (TPR) repeat protein
MTRERVAAENVIKPVDKPFTCPIIIGRARELAELNALIETAGSAPECGHVALISGEAGVGKSRLAAEVKLSAREHGFQLIEGPSFEADRSYPYALVLELAHAFFTCSVGSSPATDNDLRELVRLLPDLALQVPDEAPISSARLADPKQERRRLFTLLIRLFTERATQQPLLVVVEDAHWCDESSLEFLLTLARRCAHQPIVLLFTYRTEDSSPVLTHWLAQLDRERPTLDLALRRLTRAETAAMAQATLSMPHALDAALTADLYSLTEGNPFFVEEALRSLIASGELRQVDGVWTRLLATLHGHTLTPFISWIPMSAQDTIQRRVERLSGEARQALTLAAVAGRRFDFALLQEAQKFREDQVIPLMKELIAAQLVVEEAPDQFVFRHALTREAIYSQLLARERRSLHRVLAEALEALSPSPWLREAHLADLARHSYAAGAWAQALEYETRAGEKALALYAPRAAVEHLSHAVDSASRADITVPGAVYLARGQAHETLGDFERACDDYESARDAAQVAVDGALEWQSMMALGFLWSGRDYTQAATWVFRARDLAERLGDQTLQARSLNRIGNWRVNTGRIEEGLQAHHDALRLFEEQHDTQGIAETLDLLGTAHGIRGDRIQAVASLSQAIPLFRDLGDTQRLISSLAMRAIQSMPGSSDTTFAPLQSLDACAQDASEALQTARQVESLAGQAFAENALGHTFLSFGEFGSALMHAREARRIATEIEHQQWLISAQYCLGRIYTSLLAPAPAISALEEGLALARGLGSAFWIATLAAQKAVGRLLAQDIPSATATLQGAMPREQLPRTMAERDVAVTWGELALAEGEPDKALQIAERLLATAPGKAPGQVPQPIPRLLRLQGEALTALSRLGEAVDVLRRAKQGALERNARPILWTIHRALARAYQLQRRKNLSRRECAAARLLVEELATTLDDVSLRERFLQAAVGSLPQRKPRTAPKASAQAAGGLTAREREVAALVAQGKTSRDIADLLVISERTAEAHVGNILGKLGFSARAQIAAWAVENALIERR